MDRYSACNSFDLCHLLFGLGYALNGKAISPTILVYLFPLLGISVELIVAYWNEKTGVLLGFGCFLALFVMIGVFVSIEDMQDDFTTFLFLLLSLGLFFVSYLLRKKL